MPEDDDFGAMTRQTALPQRAAPRRAAPPPAAPAAARPPPAARPAAPLALDVDSLVSAAVPSVKRTPSPQPAAKPAPAPAFAADEDDELDLSDELNEVRFFLEQGLQDQAREVLNNLATFYPDHAGVQGLQQELEQGADVPITFDAPGPELYHSSEAVEAALADELAALPVEGELQDSIDDVFEQFKKGVEQQVDAADYSTHFDLGIAYKEMGLLDDAIREFERTTQAPQYEINARTMIGLCQLQQGSAEQALESFMRGLASSRVTAREVIALRYEIGLAFEGMGRFADAARFYEKASTMDPTFRDVATRLSEAQEHASEGPAAAPGELEALLGDGPARKSDKISSFEAAAGLPREQVQETGDAAQRLHIGHVADTR